MHRVFETLERAAARGTTCLVATHDKGVPPYLDHAFAMSYGRLNAAGDTPEGLDPRLNAQMPPATSKRTHPIESKPCASSPATSDAVLPAGRPLRAD
jgi:hypothetical protein